MEKTFEKLILKGYKIHNRRILNPLLYTSKETKLRDLVQELALVVEWFKITHHIWITVGIIPFEKGRFFEYSINGWDELIHQNGVFDSPQEAYLEAINYSLEKII
jgi:hypothetical protein